MAMHGELTLSQSGSAGLDHILPGPPPGLREPADFLRDVQAMKERMSLMYDTSMLAEANMRLAHENMRLRAMHENARLTHEHMVLRRQSEALASLGLRSQAPLGWPHVQGVRWNGCSSFSTPLEASTIAGSSPPGSLYASRAPSHSDHESDHGSVKEEPQQPDSVPTAQTTVMLRNLPNNYTRKMLVDLLLTEGYGGAFDFIYLPIDFKSKSGLGYAFVNLTSPEVAREFYEHFTGFQQWGMASDKVCKATWSDSLQGIQAHIERYRNSPVMHESVPAEQKPLLFSGMEEVPFPAPTKKIHAPRPWRRRH